MMTQHTSSPFNWETIKGLRVFSASREVLGIVTDIDYLTDRLQPMILVNASDADVPRTLKISTRMVGIISAQGIYLDAVPRWAEEDDASVVYRGSMQDAPSLT